MTTPRLALKPLRLTLALLLFGLGGVGYAQNLLYTTTGGTMRDDYTGGGGCLFTTTSSGSVVVSHLGYFSTNAVSGLARSHSVGVYSGSLTSPSLLAQVTVPAGTAAYYYNKFYWVQLDPPLLLNANTAYIVSALSYASDGDWWGNNFTPTWNSYFVGSQGTTTRYYVYPPGGTTWPQASFTKVSNNQTYCLEGLGNLPQGPAKVGLATSTNQLGVTGLQSFTLTAFSSGATPITYQWWQNGVALSSGTSQTLTVPSAWDTNSGTYYFTATNSLGGEQSANIPVAVYTVPTNLIVAPTTYGQTQTLFAGANAKFAVTSVSGVAPFSYQWYTNGTADSTASSTTYALANVQATSPNAIACVVANAYGSATNTWSLVVVPRPTAAYPAAVLADHPIGYWRLNEADNGTGNGNYNAVANDYWGGNSGVYTNTLLGQTGYSQGLSNQFLYFPATDPTESSAQFGYYPGFNARTNYAGNIPGINFAATNQTTNFSIEAWAKGDATQNGVNGSCIAAKGAWAAEQFTLDTGGTSYSYRFTMRDAQNNLRSATSNTNFPDANWHHLVGVLDEVHSNLSLYVDGVKVATTLMPTATNGVLNSAVPASIGCRLGPSGAYSQQFFGNLNDVAIYNYALSTSQVTNHYLAAGISPRFTLQPPASTNVNEGATLSIPAQAIGSLPLSYQWYDVTFGSPGTAVSGQTGPTLVINNISQAAYDGHTFALTVTNLYGQATSSVYVSVVAGPPNTVTVTPATPPTMYAGLPVVFTATAQGSQPFYYQWSVDGSSVGVSTSAYTNTVAVGTHSIGCTVTNYVGMGSPSPATVSLTGVAAPADSYGLRVLNDQPLAYWRLDEAPSSSYAIDYVGGHNGYYYSALNGVPGFSPSDADTATEFGNGVATYSMAQEYDQSGSGIPNLDFSTQGANVHFSIEAWVNAPAGQPSGAGIVAKGYGNGGEQFSLDAYTGYFRFYVHNAANNATRTAQSTNIGPDGTWHHLVAVCDEANGVVALYIDGALNATGGMAPGEGLLGPLPVGAPILTSIGSRMKNSTDTAFSFQLTNAVVDEVAIYGYALSSGTVAAHYAAAAVPPSIYVQPAPASLERYQGPALQYSASASGTPPLAYQWRKNSAPISSATTTLLNFASIAPADTALYDLVVTNTAGATTSSVVALTVLAPATGYESQILADGPLAYWRFNEANGSTIAYDYIGGLNGTYGASTTNGVPGPSAPDFTGFESTNLAVAMNHTLGTAASYVTAPALNLNTNTLTLTCWVYPFGDITNYQSVVYSRASTYSKGITYIGLGNSRFNTVGYTWNQNNVNTYGWPSGLITPPGQWSFVALTIAPTRAIMYVGTNGILRAATNAIAHDVEAFNGATLLGADTASNDRTFMGRLDEVTVYGSTLSGAQVADLYSVAAMPPVVTLTIQRSGANLVLGWSQGTLLAAPTPNGPWTNVPNAAPPSYPVSPIGQQLFYRVLVH